MFQIQRGKLHGSLDVSLAVMSINKKSKRIDLDAGDNLYHLKVITQPRSERFQHPRCFQNIYHLCHRYK